MLSVGEPYGLNRSVAAGIVGGMDRHFSDDPELLFVQTDLALNPGNSGGPLLDAAGDIVGMNMRTVVGAYGAPGVSLSIPIEIVLDVVAELRASGSIVRPRLGAEFDDVPRAVALRARPRHDPGRAGGHRAPRQPGRAHGAEGRRHRGGDERPPDRAAAPTWRACCSAGGRPAGTRLVVLRGERGADAA